MTVKALSYPRLAASEICVAFYPHTALKFYSSFKHIFFHSLKEFGIFFVKPLEHLRLRLGKIEAVVYRKVANLIGKSTRYLSLCFAYRPQPAKIYMRVTYAVISRCLILWLFFYSRLQKISCRACSLLFVNLITLLKSLVYFFKSWAFFVEHGHNEEEIDIVVVILIYLFVVYANVATA